MMDTMNSVQPPRMTALRELHEAETGGPFSILIGTILSARTKDESTTKAVKVLFSKYKNPEELAKAKVKDVEKLTFDERVSLRLLACQGPSCIPNLPELLKQDTEITIRNLKLLQDNGWFDQFDEDVLKEISKMIA